MKRILSLGMVVLMSLISASCIRMPTQELSTIYVAGGCFWGVEEYFSRIEGVVDAVSGYANGKSENPRYSDVVYADTGHAETVQVTYDPTVISLEELVAYYLKVIDPTLDRRTGGDTLTYYRHGIYYMADDEGSIIDGLMQEEALNYTNPIVVEVEPLIHFYVAEEEHQDYLKKFPEGYCHIDLDKAND